MNIASKHELLTSPKCPDCLGGIATAPAFEDFINDGGLEWDPTAEASDPNVLLVNPFDLDYLNGDKI